MKKALSIILTVVMVLGTLSIMSVASSADVELTLAGSGTATDPYLIGSKDDFINFNNYVNNGTGWGNSCSSARDCAGVYFLMTDDVDMTGEEYVPVGYWNGVFKGTFDGGNHTVKGLTSDHSGGYTMSSFIANANGATVKNLTLENALATGNNTVGLVVGNAKNTLIENVTLAGVCSVTVSSDKVGGFVGEADTNTKLVNCTIAGTLTVVSTSDSGYNKCVGGFIGNDNGADIVGAVISGTVNASTKCQCAAGVAGLVGGDAEISNIVISGTVNASANTNVAAIAGQIESGNTVVIDGVEITDTAVIDITGKDGDYTSSGGGIIVGCSWTGSHVVKNIDYSGTATIKGGGGDGNGFVFGKMNQDTQTVYNVNIGGKITFNANFYNYGLLAGKIQNGTVNAVGIVADGEVVFNNASNSSEFVGDLTSSGTLNGINLDASAVTFNNVPATVNGSGSLNLVDSRGAFMNENAIVVKDPETDGSIDSLLVTMGIGMVYANGGLADLFESASVAPMFTGSKIVGEDSVTFLFELFIDDLDYDSVEMTVVFKRGGEVVNTKTQTFTTVYRTVRDVASVNEDTALVQGIEYIPAEYLAALIINGVPAGDYDVEYTVTAAPYNVTYTNFDSFHVGPKSFAYEKIDGVDGYRITGIGTITDTDLVFPSAIEGLPVLEIGANAFYGNGSITSVVIPDTVTTIGLFAFDGCGSLASVTIPDSVTVINNCAFYACGSLTSIVLPNGLKTINDQVFASCYKLTSIVIPVSVTEIKDEAFFYSCDDDVNVYYTGTPDQWSSIKMGSFNFGIEWANMTYNYDVPAT